MRNLRSTIHLLCNRQNFFKNVVPLHATVAQSSTNYKNKYVLAESYDKTIKAMDSICLRDINGHLKKIKPLAGTKILVDIHITDITLMLLDVLQNAGAQVDVTAAKGLSAHSDAIESIRKAGVTYYPNGEIPSNKLKKYYDVVYDCGANMLNTIEPIVGMVELTHTANSLYSNILYPVITVDKSEVKKLETYYGTGIAFIEVLLALTENSLSVIRGEFYAKQADLKPHLLNRNYLRILASLMDAKSLFCNHKFMIFGYGKVGAGIANALFTAGAKKENIYIVEGSAIAAEDVKKRGYHCIYLDTTIGKNFQQAIIEIRKCLPSIYACITATGVPNIMSRYFNEHDFEMVPFKINMGTPDEWGENFSSEFIVNSKMAANFALPFPTPVTYLDPTFTLFVIAGLQLFQRQLSPGLHTVATDLDQCILAHWQSRQRWYKNTVSDHINEKLVRINDIISTLKSNPKMTAQSTGSKYNSHNLFKNYSSQNTDNKNIDWSGNKDTCINDAQNNNYK